MPLILIRHAESVATFTGPDAERPLSAAGHAQAQALVAQFAGQRIDRIHSSPYLRALDTVRPLAASLGVPVEICDDLRERNLSGGMIPDYLDVLERSWRDFDFALPDCESARAAQRRGVAAIARLAEADRTIVISSHGQLIALILHARDPSFGFEAWKAMTNPHIFVLE
jgi:2,3-bisphosphoglycerate-dependent phosphoglycerate mutase